MNRTPRTKSSRPKPGRPAAEQPVRALAVVNGGRPDTPVRTRRPRHGSANVGQPMYVADDVQVGHLQANRPEFMKSIQQVKAMTAVGSNPNVPANTTLAAQRGYKREDLFAIAEIGYHYLLNGGLDLALSIFEGLCAISPDEAYFALALGLTFDRLGEPNQAIRWYDRAARLDPSEGRADVNRAELEIEAGRYDNAKKLLNRGAAKAKHKGDDALLTKATAILRHLERTSGRGRRAIASQDWSIR